MIRTQVYLTARERNALQVLSRQTGKSQSELIRMAVDRLAEEYSEADRVSLLRRGRGLWKNRNDLPDARTLRAEWDRS